MSEPLKDDYGRTVHVGGITPGTVTVNIREGMTAVLASFSGERLDAFREAVDRAAMPGQPGAGALDPAARPAADGEIVSPSCNYEVVEDARGRMVDVGADLGEVELAGHKLDLAAARELAAGLAASIRHCEWWAAENGGGDA